MKREAKLLLAKACDSLILSIELFNRPHDRGRPVGVLIFLDHSFEMLLKSSILHRNGKIRDGDAAETIGFDACVRRSHSDGRIKYLTDEQVLVLQAINGQRDAAQHYLLNISESQLYLHVQSGVTLFRDILLKVFKQDLRHYLPNRVLPISTEPPVDLVTLFDSEVEEVKKLLQPGRRRHTEALARLRPLAILNAAIHGESGQPSDRDLRKIGKAVAGGRDWEAIFEGVASIRVVSEGSGPTLSVRISKKEGPPLQLVPEGTPGAAVVAVKRVNELDYYSLGAKGLAAKIGITVPKLVAVVEHIGLRKDSDCYKDIRISGSTFKRYSPKALERLTTALEKDSIDDIWRRYKELRSQRVA